VRRQPKPEALELVEKRTDGRDQSCPLGINQNPKRPRGAKLENFGYLTSERIIKNANGIGRFQRQGEHFSLTGA